jgi:hypothetical protein
MGTVTVTGFESDGSAKSSTSPRRPTELQAKSRTQ